MTQEIKIRYTKSWLEKKIFLLRIMSEQYQESFILRDQHDMNGREMVYHDETLSFQPCVSRHVIFFIEYAI